MKNNGFLKGKMKIAAVLMSAVTAVAALPMNMLVTKAAPSGGTTTCSCSGFNDPDGDGTCTCGHSSGDHSGGSGPCNATVISGGSCFSTKHETWRRG